MGFIRSAGHALGRHGVARVRVQSPGGGSVCVAVSLLAAAVLSGADCGVRVCCSALHVAGTLGMGAASGCNMRAAYCIHSGFFRGRQEKSSYSSCCWLSETRSKQLSALCLVICPTSLNVTA